MSPISLEAGGTADLLDRMSRADDFSDAVLAIFDAVLVPAGIERAALLVRAEEELRGKVGMGWPQEGVRQVQLSLSEVDHEVVRAFLAGDLTIRDDIRLEHLPALERCCFLPLDGVAKDRLGFGLLLFDPQHLDLAEVRRIGDQVLRVAPFLARLCELDRLQVASAQLERHRELLTAIINALPDPVLITDAGSNILLENRRAEHLFTSADTESEGRRHAVEINNLLFSSFLTRSTGSGSEINARELNLVDPTEGGDLLFEVLSTPLPDGLAAEGATVSVLRNVTDLKRATTELEHQFKRLRQAEVKSRRERDRLNLILENVGDPILVTDDQANIILMNREAERLFEIPSDAELDSRQRGDVRANDTKFSSFVSDFALSGDPTRIAEFQLTDPETNRSFPVEVVSGKILNERAEMTAIVSILHDLTKAVENERLASELTLLNESLEDRIRAATMELEERNRQLEWQSRELERAYHLKSQFLASMSHELRTPINALLGYTSLMRDRIYGELTPRQEEALQRMYSASQHLLELVNDVLDLAKIEAGKMPVHLERVDISLVIRELSLTIEPMVRRKNLEYRVEIEPDLPILETDRTKVKQIVLNLLSNAVKFTHKGHISVRARRAGAAQGVHITVADSGIGIKEEDVRKIFEDFRQVDQSSTREYGGTGLGLSITKKLLYLLGGSIRVDSCPGEGSSFTVWLPLRSEPVEDREISEAARIADEAVITPGHESC